jgi:hypothetical protein
MCDPGTLLAASLAISAASAGAGAAAQQKAADATNSYQTAQYTATSKAALSAYQRNITQAATESSQEATSAGDQATTLHNQAGQVAGTIALSAAERGVTGNSIEALFSDLARVESQDRFNIATNLGWSQAQIQESLFGSQATNQNRITQATPNPVAGANYLAAGLTFGSQALTSYGNYKKQTDPAWSGIPTP